MKPLGLCWRAAARRPSGGTAETGACRRARYHPGVISRPLTSFWILAGLVLLAVAL
jgi:hypothetical protein